MKYTLLLYNDESRWADQSPEDAAQQFEVYGKYIGALQEAGVLESMDWLSPTTASTTLSLASGSKVVQDGPFAETKEQLGGYFVINVDNLDAALAWAEKCPAAHYGTIEVRATAMPDGNPNVS